MLLYGFLMGNGSAKKYEQFDNDAVIIFIRSFTTKAYLTLFCRKRKTFFFVVSISFNNKSVLILIGVSFALQIFANFDKAK
jgi:hypothetical protein